jgi:hypothetical protein
MYNIIPLCSTSFAIKLPANQYTEKNILKPPVAQVCHVKQNNTQFMKTTVQRPPMYRVAQRNGKI